jgi:hypothetical protein
VGVFEGRGVLVGVKVAVAVLVGWGVRVSDAVTVGKLVGRGVLVAVADLVALGDGGMRVAVIVGGMVFVSDGMGDVGEGATTVLVPAIVGSRNAEAVAEALTLSFSRTADLLGVTPKLPAVAVVDI